MYFGYARHAVNAVNRTIDAFKAYNVIDAATDAPRWRCNSLTLIGNKTELDATETLALSNKLRDGGGHGLHRMSAAQFYGRL